MKYLSVCSGIEAASVAWHPLGWEAVAFSEIEKFPSAVLAHHYPNVPNWGDMTRFSEWPDAAFDVLVGGTPCQSFSVAGLRKGLADPRGNLMLTFGAITKRYRPQWLVWENVPGVLSSKKGRDFGTFLGMLGELGYGFAYRILDAGGFNIPQHRERVFVVANFGDWRRSAAVLFEQEAFGWNRKDAIQKLCGNRIFAAFDVGMPESARREIQSSHSIRNMTPREYERLQGFPDKVQNVILLSWNTNVIAAPSASTDSLADLERPAVVSALIDCERLVLQLHSAGRSPLSVALADERNRSHLCMPPESFALAVALMTNGVDRLITAGKAGLPQGTSPFSRRSDGKNVADVSGLASAGSASDAASKAIAAMKFIMSEAGPDSPDFAPALTTLCSFVGAVISSFIPSETEAANSYCVDLTSVTPYTLIPFLGKPAADGPRYKALGNSMAVPVMAWIGQRIQAVEGIVRPRA